MKLPRFTIDGYYACDLLNHLLDDIKVWLKEEKTTCPEEVYAVERLVNFIKKHDKPCWQKLSKKNKEMIGKILRNKK